MTDDVEIWVVAGQYQARSGREADLAAVLAQYTVLTRGVAGCRNVDLCASVTHPGRYLVIQKWVSPSAQRAHFDSEVMVEMARSCNGLLTAPPAIDLWDGASAHDLL